MQERYLALAPEPTARRVRPPCARGRWAQNQPLESAQGTDTYDFSRIYSPDNSDETFVVLTFSGGGTRAAALAYGVLDKLYKTPLNNSGKTLLSEVDVISTVSGGSFTGAYYTLFGNKIFNDFKD